MCYLYEHEVLCDDHAEKIIVDLTIAGREENSDPNNWPQYIGDYDQYDWFVCAECYFGKG
jgi:hypothetical protein